MECCYRSAENDYINNMRHCGRVARSALELMCGLVRGGMCVAEAEECASRLCRAYGVNCLTANISSVASVCVECGGAVLTRQQRFSGGGINLRVCEECFNILRRAEAGNALENTERNLHSIDDISAPIYIKALGGGIACAAFCAFFGGAFADCVCSFLAGLAVCFMLFASDKLLSPLLRSFLASASGGILCLLICKLLHILGLECNMPTVILGSIMPVIPGLKLCMGIQNMMRGNIRFGLYGIANSLACALTVAAGYAVASWVFIPSPVQITLSESAAVRLISSSVGAYAFGIMFGNGAKRSVHGAICAAFGYAAYMLCQASADYVALFVAAFCCSSAAILFAFALKIPAAVLLMPSVVPLVPGAALFVAAQTLLAGETSGLKELLISSFFAFGCVSAGGAAAASLRRVTAFTRAHMLSLSARLRALRRNGTENGG